MHMSPIRAHISALKNSRVLKQHLDRMQTLGSWSGDKIGLSSAPTELWRGGTCNRILGVADHDSYLGIIRVLYRERPDGCGAGKLESLGQL